MTIERVINHGIAYLRLTASLGLKRFVLVADRGMYSGTNMCHVTDAGNGYIVAKSLRKSTKQEIAWAVGPDGYDFSDEKFRCKSRIVSRTVVLPDGKRRTFKEKVVVYWRRSFYERERHENASFLAFVERLKANPGGFRITAAQSQSLRRFLKTDVLDRKTGNILDGPKLAAMIDDQKLSEFNELFGYYQIVTSELDMPDREVIDKYHGLTQIEDQFREMKSTLETRPIYVRSCGHWCSSFTTAHCPFTHLHICTLREEATNLTQWLAFQGNGPDF